MDRRSEDELAHGRVDEDKDDPDDEESRQIWHRRVESPSDHAQAGVEVHVAQNADENEEHAAEREEEIRSNESFA